MKHAALLCLLVLSVSCSSDASGPGEGHLGRYRLRTIDGRQVPTIHTETANSRLEFLSGALRLNSDGTFTDSTTIRVTPMFRGQPLPGGEVVESVDVAWGLHHMSGDTIYLDSVRGEHYFMILQPSGSLTQDLGGSTLVYRR